MYRQRWGGYYGWNKKVHKTQKPVELMEWCIGAVNGVVLDYFLGSGTSIVAAENLGRLCRGCEISPAYTAVSLQRLADMSLEVRKVE